MFSVCIDSVSFGDYAISWEGDEFYLCDRDYFSLLHHHDVGGDVGSKGSHIAAVVDVLGEYYLRFGRGRFIYVSVSAVVRKRLSDLRVGSIRER